MKEWRVIYRVACFALAVLLAVGLVCVFLPKCRTYHDLQQRKLRIEGENHETETATRKFQTQEERLQWDRSFVERTARELGMAKPGETVFRVTREGATNSSPGTYRAR